MSKPFIFTGLGVSLLIAWNFISTINFGAVAGCVAGYTLVDFLFYQRGTRGHHFIFYCGGTRGDRFLFYFGGTSGCCKTKQNTKADRQCKSVVQVSLVVKTFCCVLTKFSCVFFASCVSYISTKYSDFVQIKFFSDLPGMYYNKMITEA